MKKAKIGLIILITGLLFIMGLAGCKSVPEEATELSTLEAKVEERENLIASLRKEIEAGDRTREEKDFLNNQLSMLTDENTLLRQVIAEGTAQAQAALNEARLILEPELQSGDVEIMNYNGVIVIHVKNRILFDPNMAEIRDENRDVLLKISTLFDLLPDRIIRVEGHTATGPDINFPSSWELGSARAVNVVRFFQNDGNIDPSRMVAVSFGEYRPLASNETEEGKSRNRRIEIVLLQRPLYQWQELIPND